MRICCSLSVAALLAAALSGQAQNPLKLQRAIPVSGMTGGFDHLTYDPASDRIFATAEDQGAVYVFMFSTGARLAAIQGFGKPHSILALPGAPAVLVIDSEGSKSTFLGSSSLQRTRPAQLPLGANCLLYDSRTGWAFITAGGDRVGMNTSQVVALEPSSGGIIKSTDVDALHLQPMALDATNRRLFVSIADHKSIGVFDEQNLQMLAEWKLGHEEHHHQPIAFDAEHHKLFVAIDHPGELIAIDTQTGKVVSSLKIPDDADALDYEPSNRRLFIPCGDGFLMVLDAADPLHVKVIQQIETGKDASTGVWLSKERKYLLGVPQSGSMRGPEIWEFSAP